MVAAEGMAAPTAVPEEEEEALEVVATLDTAEPQARVATGRRGMASPRATAVEATGDTRRETPTELAAPSPRKAAARALTSLVNGNRLVIPYLVDTASSAERFSSLSLADDRAKPVSSFVAHARTFTRRCRRGCRGQALFHRETSNNAPSSTLIEHQSYLFPPRYTRRKPRNGSFARPRLHVRYSNAVR